MSGAVFEVTDERPTRKLGDKDLFFCCGGCASFFDGNAEKLVKARGWS